MRGLLTCLIVLVVALKIVMQFETSRLIWDFVKTIPPVIGTCARKIAMSRFSRALAVAYSAGLPMSQAVAVAADASANVAISRAIRRAVPALQSGRGLTETLARTHVVMPMVVDMLATGEKTGSMDKVLEKVSDYMDDEVHATIFKLSIALTVLAILVLGGVVLVICIGSYTNYFKSIGL